jgi:hypothetical protein
MYALNSYNWILFGTWEFDARHQEGYLGGVDYFDCELAAENDDDDNMDEDKGAEDDDATKAEYEASSDNHVQGGDNDHDVDDRACDLETQPSGISEEEAIAVAMANSELDQLAMWDGLTL